MVSAISFGLLILETPLPLFNARPNRFVLTNGSTPGRPTVRTRSTINSTKMLGARQNCLTAAVDNYSVASPRIPRFIISFFCPYPLNGFQNRWLTTADKVALIGRYRFCSMQIVPYQGPWGNYTGNGGKLTTCREVIPAKYTGRFIFIIVQR